MNDNVRQAIEAQIGNEFAAAHTYLSMSSYFETEALPGFASWMREQSQEEVVHAMKLFDFLVDSGVAVELPGVPKPENNYSSVIEALNAALQHEQKVTKQIHGLFELAQQEKDYSAQVMLQWFVTEQLEEEKNTGGILERAKMSEGSRSALLILDSELGSRQGDPTV